MHCRERRECLRFALREWRQFGLRDLKILRGAWYFDSRFWGLRVALGWIWKEMAEVLSLKS